jgi:hypothetical protein
VGEKWHVERGGVYVEGEGYKHARMVKGQVSGGQVFSKERRSVGKGVVVSGGGLGRFQRGGGGGGGGGGVGGKKK